MFSTQFQGIREVPKRFKIKIGAKYNEFDRTFAYQFAEFSDTLQIFSKQSPNSVISEWCNSVWNL